MTSISIRVEPIVVTEDGLAVAKIIPIPVAKTANPFLNRKLLPGFAELQARMTGGAYSSEICFRDTRRAMNDSDACHIAKFYLAERDSR